KCTLAHRGRVIHVRGPAIVRMVRDAVRAARRPERTIDALGEDAIVKIATEQPQLPELVCDVLTDVGDNPVGANDHLLPFFRVLVALHRRLAWKLGAGPLGVGSW